MGIKREKIKIDREILMEVINDHFKQRTDYIIVKDEITSSDPEDGGADHEAVIKRLSDGKFFRLYYCDWHMDYNQDAFPEELEEVFPKQVTTTIYE